jgi:hypothetical protein
MTRRAFFATLVGVPLMGMNVPALGASGVHLTGRLDATETERSEQMANFGKACAIVVNDKALWASLEPLLNSTVQLSIFQP